MTTGDASVHCRYPTWMRIGSVPLAGMFSSGWLLFLVEGPQAHPLACAALCAVFSLPGLVMLAAAFGDSYRADARGISWRDWLGRRRHAPWSEVCEVGAHQPRGALTMQYRVVLTGGRSLTWDGWWSGCAALYELAVAATDRGVYRSVGDRTVDVPMTFGERSRFDRLQVGFAAGTMLATGLGIGGGGLWAVATVSRAQGDIGAPLGFFSLVVLPMLLACVCGSGTYRAWYRDPTRDVVTLDARGFSVRRGEAHASARWDEVVKVVQERVHGVDCLRVVSLPASFVAGPLAQSNGFLARLLAERVPLTVRENWALADEAKRGDVPATTAPDTFRHRLSVLGLSPWSVDALAALVICFPLAMAVVMRPDDDPLPVAPQRLLVVGGLVVAAMLVHRLTRAACFIEVSPDGCLWNGLRHRRRFAWSDVVALALPDVRAPRPLTVTLSDGTRLRHLDGVVAGHAHLIRTLRRRLPHLVA